ncbi:MAG: hypothetical protein ACE14V_14205 [bacterium]
MIPIMTNDRKTWRNKLKHAFAVKQPPLPADGDYTVLDKAAQFIVRRQLVAPAIMALQSMTPLNFIGSQALIVLRPLIGPLFNEPDYQKLIEILEHRDGIELFVQRIEKASKESSKLKAQSSNKIQNPNNKTK